MATDKARTIIIGDVHGCIEELDELLEELKPRPGTDRVIFIGDLINKGPASAKVYKRYKELEATAIIGNHEMRLLQQADKRSSRDGTYKALRKEFGKKAFSRFIDDVRTWPSYIEEDDFLAVHAGLVPDQHPSKTDPVILANIRTWDGEGKDFQNLKNPPWFDFYHDEKLVVFGHWAALGTVTRDHVIGLDSGCVYGKELSALVLPERVIYSVEANRFYCPIRK